MSKKITSILVAGIVGIYATMTAQAQANTLGFSEDELHFYQDAVALDLAPDSPFTSAIERVLTDLEPKVGIEIRLSIPVSPRVFTPEGWVTVYNILNSVSTMEGIEYYSASRGRMRTFYHKSHVVADEEDDTRVDDPVFTQIPAQSELFAFQRDSSFGNNLQHFRYTSETDQILVQMENLTTMVYKIVPLVTPGKLQTFLLVQQEESSQSINFYGNLAVRRPRALWPTGSRSCQLYQPHHRAPRVVCRSAGAERLTLPE